MKCLHPTPPVPRLLSEQGFLKITKRKGKVVVLHTNSTKDEGDFQETGFYQCTGVRSMFPLHTFIYLINNSTIDRDSVTSPYDIP